MIDIEPGLIVVPSRKNEGRERIHGPLSEFNLFRSNFSKRPDGALFFIRDPYWSVLYDVVHSFSPADSVKLTV